MINARMPGFIPSFLATGVSFAIDLAGERELIPVRILEDGDRSPGLVLGFLGKSDAFGLQHFGGREHVVTPKGNGLKLANAPLMTFGRIEGEPRFGARNEEFNPPLRVREGVVGDYLQPSASV